jgi:Protein of unknown function (DUF3179)
VWTREVDGLRLTFHLAGINNQNFIMRDEETGTYWQQITGRAISGPLKGKQLTLVPFDELTFATWKTEEPAGTVLNDVPKFVAGYSKKDWDVRMKRAPVVIDFREPGLENRDLMLGIQAFGASRAFPVDRIIKEQLIKDHLGAEPILVVLGPDGKSIRAFRNMAGAPDFYRVTPAKSDALLVDAPSGSEWNFQGCAISGSSKGTCLTRLTAIQDYWFDWRNYNPTTTIYGMKPQP